MFEKTVLPYFVLFCLILASVPFNATAPEADTSLQQADLGSSFFKDPESNQTISNMMEEVNSTKINEYITKLQNFETRYIETEGNENATRWINQKFSSFGLKSRLQNFTYEGEELSNVIATQRGMNPDKKSSTIVVGAHFDSITGSSYYNKSAPAPGADDDASGVAATLETARILSKYNYSRTIKYCAWNAEEVGLVGSNYYVNSIVDKEEIEIDAMFQYDMIGNLQSGKKNIKVHADQESKAQLDYMLNVNQTYMTDLNINPIYDSSMTASDHSSFWSHNYNATMTIEENMNGYIHTNQDTIDRISMSMVKSVTQLSVGCTAHLGELVNPDPFLFYLHDPESGSLHHGGESMKINWFLAHENLSSSEFNLKLNCTTNNETYYIGNYQGKYQTYWELPEINGNLTLNCQVFHPDGSLIFEDDYRFTVDSVAPEISKVEPPARTDRIDSQRDNFTVKFSEEIESETFSKNNVYFRPGLEYYYLTLVENDTLEINMITSLNSLKKNTSYSLIVRNITDIAGNPLGEDHVFDFTTAKNKAPTANFTFEPEKLEVYRTIEFESTSEDVDGEIVEYRWDFGGVKNSDKEDPNMTFKEEGISYVNLTVRDKEGASSSVNRTITVDDPIQGEIRVDPEKPITSDEINFSFTHQDDIDFETLKWDFGDGSESDKLNPAHSYDQTGVFNVSIKLNLARGYTYICNESVRVFSPPPEANLSVKRDSSTPGKFKFRLNFSDNESEVTNITWNLADGSIGYGKEVTQKYSERGTYNVTVKITAENGLTRTYEKTVQVEEDPQTENRVFYYVLPSVGIVIILLELLSQDEK